MICFAGLGVAMIIHQRRKFRKIVANSSEDFQNFTEIAMTSQTFKDMKRDNVITSPTRSL